MKNHDNLSGLTAQGSGTPLVASGRGE